MACSSNHVRDIESIYSKNDKQFHSITEQNIHKYEELVLTLYNGCKNDKKLFNKIYAKLQKGRRYYCEEVFPRICVSENDQRK